MHKCFSAWNLYTWPDHSNQDCWLCSHLPVSAFCWCHHHCFVVHRLCYYRQLLRCFHQYWIPTVIFFFLNLFVSWKIKLCHKISWWQIKIWYEFHFKTSYIEYTICLSLCRVWYLEMRARFSSQRQKKHRIHYIKTSRWPSIRNHWSSCELKWNHGT